MILEAAAALVLAGFLLFAMGFWADRPELAMFGAILVIGVGAAGMVGGYQVQDGHNETKLVVEEAVADADFSSSSHMQSRDVSAQEQAPTGVDWGSGGNTLVVTGTGSSSVHSYEAGAYDLSTASHEASLDVSGEDISPMGVELEDGGSVLLVSGDESNAVYRYDLAEPGNVSTASLAGSLDVTGQATQPRGIDMSADGTRLFVVDEGGSDMHSYDLGSAYDLSTASYRNTVDLSAIGGAPVGVSFGADGERAVGVGEGSEAAHMFELGGAFAPSTMSYTGDYLDVSADVGRPGGLSYERDGRRLYVSDAQSGTVEEYDTGETATSEETEVRKQYRDLEVHPSFPLDIIVLLLGSVMLMGSSGAASETDLRDDEQKKPPWERGR